VSRGQTIPLMRIGLTISVLVGGAITAFILLAGMQVSSFSSYEELANVFVKEMGSAGRIALGLGLFAAGFSSAITAPYAASLVATTVFAWSGKQARWMWMGVLAVGLFFGITQVKPIPVILLVQTLNGFILPLLGGYLILVINDRQLVSAAHRPSPIYNLVLMIIFATLLLLGLHSIDKTVSQLWLGNPTHWLVVWPLVLSVTGLLAYRVFRAG
jgi:Mn2+/Fe2+ NRAMP family transporter